MLDGIETGDHAYFVHSYHFRVADPAHRLAHVDYGGPITAIVGAGQHGRHPVPPREKPGRRAAPDRQLPALAALRWRCRTILDDIASEMQTATDRGTVASYIPELARVDPDQFGIAIALPDGQVLTAGDAHVPFSIQSISKVFMLAIALGRLGDSLWSRVGREPSGQAFNSILQLEHRNRAGREIPSSTPARSL